MWILAMVAFSVGAHDKDRSRLAFVVHETVDYRNLEVWEVWSVAVVVDEYPGPDVTRELVELVGDDKY